MLKCEINLVQTFTYFAMAMDLDTYVMTAFQDYLDDVPDGHIDDPEFEERKRDATTRYKNGDSMRLPESKVFLYILGSGALYDRILYIV